MNRVLCTLSLCSLALACSGGDDDGDAATPDSGTISAADASVTADAGVDAGSVDAGEDVDAGPPDSGIPDPYETIRSTGSPDNRIDVVIVGDGYTLEELATAYSDHVADAVGRTFSSRRRQNDPTQPFRSYRNYFNVHQVNLASNESGIDNAMRDVDTALDAREGPCGGIGGGANCPLDFAKAAAAIDEALAGSNITPDIRVVILNTDTDESGAYDSPQGSFVVLGGGFGDSRFVPSEMFMRGIGQAWAGLARETTDSPGGAFPNGAPLAANTSTSPNGSWPLWDGYVQGNLDSMDVEAALNPLGTYEGAAGYATGVYRPTQNSKLGDLVPAPFNAVSRERIVQRIFETMSPIDDFLDNSQRLDDPNQLYVDPVDDDRYTISWYVDGVDIGHTQTSFGPVAFGVAAGVHTVTASVTDNTTFVRGDRTGLDGAVSWQIRISP